MKTHDKNWDIGSPFCNIANHRDNNGVVEYVTGTYNYKSGTVLIYQQGYLDGDNKYVSLSVYRNGRGHYRTIKGKLYTNIGLARKAGEFARHLDSIYNIEIKEV